MGMARVLEGGGSGIGRKLMLIIMVGGSGSGKSVIARGIFNCISGGDEVDCGRGF